MQKLRVLEGEGIPALSPLGGLCVLAADPRPLSSVLMVFHVQVRKNEMRHLKSSQGKD